MSRTEYIKENWYKWVNVSTLAVVLAAYDSVNLINKLNSKETKTEEYTSAINTNKEHVKIILGKDWFVETLTAEQKAELETISKLA